MNKKTIYDELMQDKQFARLMAQEDLIMEVTEAICAVLEKENIKRKDLADRLGKTKGFISQILNGGRNITLRTIADIAHSLNYKVTFGMHKKQQNTGWMSLCTDWGNHQDEPFKINHNKASDDYPPNGDNTNGFENELSMAS